MYLTKKKKFSHELVLPTLKYLLQKIKLIADEFYKSNKNSQNEGLNQTSNRTIHHIKTDDIILLPLDALFDEKDKNIVRQIADNFIKGNKLQEKVSLKFPYQELIKILG